MASDSNKDVTPARHRREQVTGAFFRAVTAMAGLRPSLIPSYMRQQMQLVGVDDDMLARVLGNIRSLRDWPYAWEAEGDRWYARGDVERSAISYYLAQRPLLSDSPLKRRLYRLSLQTYEQMPHPAPLERLDLPVQGGEIAGWLQLPHERYERPLPAVVMVPGITATKEEMQIYSDPLLRRGYAVCRIDSPGYGETTAPFSRDAPNYPARVVEWLRTDPRIDAQHVHLFGMSLGGFFSLISSAECLPASTIGVSAPFHPGAYAHRLPSMNLTALQHMLGVNSFREVLTRVDLMSVAPVAEQITSPVLLFHGARDHTIPASEMDLLASVSGGPVVRRLFPQGHHGCMVELDVLLGDTLEWLRDPQAVVARETARQPHTFAEELVARAKAFAAASRDATERFAEGLLPADETGTAASTQATD